MFNRKEWSKRYYQNNKVEIKERNKKWVKTNPEKIKKYKEKWRDYNLQYSKEYYEINKKLKGISKGRKHYLYGKHLLDETKYKLSKLLKGNKNRLGAKYSEDSKRKNSEAHKGNKSSLWKGGISTENNKIRNGFEIKIWHKSCLMRDNFTCQNCGQYGGKLQVHHINNFSDFSELRFITENGVTLCEKCHIKFHKKYGKNNNTKEQIKEFLNMDEVIQ